jgi:hypothetical protein
MIGVSSNLVLTNICNGGSVPTNYKKKFCGFLLKCFPCKILRLLVVIFYVITSVWLNIVKNKKICLY